MLKPGERTENCRKMRHDCEKHGCFEKKYRCQLGKLDHLFPGSNGMSDIDGFCALGKINGHVLFLEWKAGGGVSQKDALLRLSYNGLVLLGIGDPMQMLPNRWTAFWKGKQIHDKSGPEAAAAFDECILSWATWAQNAPSDENREWLREYARGCHETCGDPIPDWLA